MGGEKGHWAQVLYSQISQTETLGIVFRFLYTVLEFVLKI